MTTQEQDSDMPQHEQASLQYCVVTWPLMTEETAEVVEVVLGGMLSGVWLLEW
jgi:hypothetical protein